MKKVGKMKIKRCIFLGFNVNRELIKDCIVNKKEWWYVDVGYFTEQITRYSI